MFPLKCKLEVLNNVQNNLHPIPLEKKRGEHGLKLGKTHL